MTREEAITIIKPLMLMMKNPQGEVISDAYYALEMAVQALSQEPCEDAISRSGAIKAIEERAKKIKNGDTLNGLAGAVGILFELPSVKPQESIGHCKDCKYFEYDSVAKVDGIPLIVAHEICNKWGDGCKTKEDGYCFLFEPQESEE